MRSAPSGPAFTRGVAALRIKSVELNRSSTSGKVAAGELSRATIQYTWGLYRRPVIRRSEELLLR